MNATTNVTKLLARLVETKTETIKLGMDLHAHDDVVCVQLDGALPQRLTTAQGATAGPAALTSGWRIDNGAPRGRARSFSAPA